MWIDYLANAVLLTGFGGILTGLWHRKKQEYFEKLFQELEKCQKYHLDYVEDIAQIPNDKNIIIFGTAKSIQSPSAQ